MTPSEVLNKAADLIEEKGSEKWSIYGIMQAAAGDLRFYAEAMFAFYRKVGRQPSKWCRKHGKRKTIQALREAAKEAGGEK